MAILQLLSPTAAWSHCGKTCSPPCRCVDQYSHHVHHTRPGTGCSGHVYLHVLDKLHQRLCRCDSHRWTQGETVNIQGLVFQGMYVWLSFFGVSVSHSFPVRNLMYGFGDDRNPANDTVNVMEEILIEYITDVVRVSLSMISACELNSVDNLSVRLPWLQGKSLACL